MIRGPLPSCAGETRAPQNPSARGVETAGEREDRGRGRGRGRRSDRKEEERERRRKGGREVRLDLIHGRKGGGVWSLVRRGKSFASSRAPPPSTHAHTHAGHESGVWLCGGLVWLVDRFPSVHHRRLTCAFTGRYRRLGHRLPNIMQRWLSVHGDWRGTA